MFEKQLLIDGKGHLMGRLAAHVAKELLSGQRVVVVRAEELVLSGKAFRRETQYQEFLGVHASKNPKRMGPYHYKAPSRLFWRTVRGMIPHKTARGKAALQRLKVFEGIPSPYSHSKRICVPSAMRVVRLLPNRKYTTLGHISEHFGWGKTDLLNRLEAKRTERAAAYHTRKTAIAKAVSAETSNLASLKDLRSQLSQLGY